MRVRFKPTVSLRTAGLAALATTLLSAALSPARAQYPERALQMIVPFTAGGAVDGVARSFAVALDRQLQQRVAVVNRDGAGGTVAFNAALASPADGYTVVFGPVTPLTVHAHWMKGLQFDASSFVPVCQTFENIFFVAAAPGSPFKSLESVLTHARARPGQLTYAHSGVASSPHLAGAELFQKDGVNLVDVPFRGEAPMLVPLKDGSIDVGVVTSNAVKTQGLTPLAVFAERRMPAFPTVPTVKELGYAVAASGYGGLMMRATTPAAIVARVESACREAVADPGYKQAAERNHQEAEYLGRDGFTARMEADRRSKAELLKFVKLER
jgi:tripartite-type tricarboxylate transporter receptor subunit TctC